MTQCWFRKRTGEALDQCLNEGVYGLPPDTIPTKDYTLWAIKSRWCVIHKHWDDVLIPQADPVDSPKSSVQSQANLSLN